MNALQFSEDGSLLVAGVGQEHRLGRWWSLKEARNSVVIVKLKKQQTTKWLNLERKGFIQEEAFVTWTELVYSIDISSVWSRCLSYHTYPLRALWWRSLFCVILCFIFEYMLIVLRHLICRCMFVHVLVLHAPLRWVQQRSRDFTASTKTSGLFYVCTCKYTTMSTMCAHRWYNNTI